MNAGWTYRPALNLDDALAFKRAVGLPVIVNGGLQQRQSLESALGDDQCDLVSMARPLIANPDLLQYFRMGYDEPPRPCDHCNRCIGRTAISPLGCYNEQRFESRRAMLDQIMAWNSPDPP